MDNIAGSLYEVMVTGWYHIIESGGGSRNIPPLPLISCRDLLCNLFVDLVISILQHIVDTPSLLPRLDDKVLRLSDAISGVPY